MSKGFIERAITAPPQGLEQIIEWLYHSSQGPELLRRVIKDSKALLPEDSKDDRSNEAGIERSAEQGKPTGFSTGAIIWLRRALLKLENLPKSDE